MDDKILTVSGAAQILKSPESTVRGFVRRHELAAVRDSAGRRLFREKDVREFAKRRGKSRRQECRIRNGVRQF